MTDPFADTVTIPDDVKSIILGKHVNKKDLKFDFHVIVDDVVLCSGESQPFPALYQRVTPEYMTPEKLPGHCHICRDAAARWAGHPEWVEGEAS